MNRKPLIGINMDYRAARKDGPAMSYLCAGYHDAIVKAGGVPVIIPILENDEDMARTNRRASNPDAAAPPRGTRAPPDIAEDIRKASLGSRGPCEITIRDLLVEILDDLIGIGEALRGNDNAQGPVILHRQ